MKLEINSLSKQFGDVKAVNNITLTLEKGVYGLLGANGMGKTTLMRMLCTLLAPTSGEILYNGENIIKLDERYRDVIGYLPQDFGYYPEFSAEDYLLYIASLKGLKYIYAKKKVKELLKMVSLEKVKNKKVKTFSGGMKRRLGIAQAVLNNPEVLILDEPTAGLDPKERIKFRNLISELAEERIILLSTHIVSDIESIANKILIMKDGRIIANGGVSELLQMIEHCVWNCNVSHTEVKNLQKQFVVSNLKTVSSGVELRIVGDKKPIFNAIEETPTLEDLFMYYFGEVVLNDENVLL